MKTYAQVQGGIVVEVIGPMVDATGNEIPIADRFTPQFVLSLMDVSTVTGIAPGWIYSGGVFSAPPAETLSQARAALNTALNASCSAAIMSGFSSSALGSTYSYPSTLTDQTNQNTVAQCPSGGLLWCATGGTWSFKSHTQAQAQSVVAAFATWLNKCQQQLASLMGQVNAASTASAVQAITWTNPT